VRCLFCIASDNERRALDRDGQRARAGVRRPAVGARGTPRNVLTPQTVRCGGARAKMIAARELTLFDTTKYRKINLHQSGCLGWREGWVGESEDLETGFSDSGTVPTPKRVANWLSNRHKKHGKRYKLMRPPLHLERNRGSIYSRIASTQQLKQPGRSDFRSLVAVRGRRGPI